MRPVALGLLCAMVAAAAGCASGESYVRQGYDFNGLRRIAVTDVQVGSGGEALRNFIGDLFSSELLRKGHNPLERRQVKAILSEQEFQETDFTSPDGAARLGRIRNVDAILVVNVPEFDDESISMTAKLLGVEQADLLWAGSGSGQTGCNVCTVVGAAVGGAVGWLIGGNESGKKATAAGGAVVGGVGGRELSPQKEKLARKVVRKIMRNFPSHPRRL